MSENGVVFEAVTGGYGGEAVLHDITGRFVLGTSTAVIGPNGAGKSTLLKTIAGLLKPQRGRLAFHGCAPCDVAYLPQRTDIERSFPLSALDLVMLGRWRETGAFGGAGEDARDTCMAALDRVGLAAFANRAVGTLSLGQLQRALFARLIVQDARILLLDEPFAAMDAATVSDLLQMIAAWRQEGRTVIAALHDLAQVRDYFPQALLLDRRVLAWGPADTAVAAAGHMHAGIDCAGDGSHC